MEAASADPVRDQDIYSQLESYDWDNDAQFQSGLATILGSATSPAQVDHLTLRARCFYFSRKSGTRVDFNAYQQWRAQRAAAPNGDVPTAPAPTETTADAQPALMGDAPAPASFAEICRLIAEGKPIPGIKEIPSTVLEGQATASTAAPRRKPWEKADASATM